jgi:hypothetical protein
MVGRMMVWQWQVYHAHEVLHVARHLAACRKLRSVALLQVRGAFGAQLADLSGISTAAEVQVVHDVTVASVAVMCGVCLYGTWLSMHVSDDAPGMLCHDSCCTVAL